MTATNPAAADPLTAGHKTTAATEAHSRMHGRTIDLGENVKAHGSVGDNTHDDTDNIQAAITAAGVGGTVIFPKPTTAYKISSALTPLGGQTWFGGGRWGRQADSGGVKLRYSGTGTALNFTSVSDCEVSNMSVYCDNTGSSVVAIELAEPFAQLNVFRNMVLYGGGTADGYGVLAHGETNCVCHNEFHNLNITNFAVGYRFSGFANANYVAGGVLHNLQYGIQVVAHSGDTTGGDDNMFVRVELDGGTGLGIQLANTANGNLFIKCVEDGTTDSVNVGSGCLDNTFIGTQFAGTAPADTDYVSNRTNYIGCKGANIGAMNFGADVNLYRSAADELRTDDRLESAVEIYARHNHADQVMIGSAGGFPSALFGTAGDTNLYRSAANTLKTDDALVVTGVLTPSSNVVMPAGYIDGTEIADPAAPDTNHGRLYFRDNGSGKTQVVARFPSGAVQVIATEP